MIGLKEQQRKYAALTAAYNFFSIDLDNYYTILDYSNISDYFHIYTKIYLLYVIRAFNLENHIDINKYNISIDNAKEYGEYGELKLFVIKQICRDYGIDFFYLDQDEDICSAISKASTLTESNEDTIDINCIEFEEYSDILKPFDGQSPSEATPSIFKCLYNCMIEDTFNIDSKQLYIDSDDFEILQSCDNVFYSHFLYRIPVNMNYVKTLPEETISNLLMYKVFVPACFSSNMIFAGIVDSKAIFVETCMEAISEEDFYSYFSEEHIEIRNIIFLLDIYNFLNGGILNQNESRKIK